MWFCAKAYGQFSARGDGKPFAQKILASCPNFYKTVEKKQGHTMQQHRPYWHTKVPQYSFSGSIYTCQIGVKTIRCHKQTFGKIATTVVLDKDENLLWSGLQWHRSCHSNEMTPLPRSMKSFSGAFSSNSRLDVREVKTESVRALSE